MQPAEATVRACSSGDWKGVRCGDTQDILYKKPPLHGQETKPTSQIHRNKTSKLAKTKLQELMFQIKKQDKTPENQVKWK